MRRYLRFFWQRLRRDIHPVMEIPSDLRDEYRLVAEKCRLSEEQNRFLLREVQRINETMRNQLLGEQFTESGRQQTQSSFDYQWADFHSGVGMANDEEFMKGLGSHICQITRLGSEWFPGKKVIDVGCGAGRYTYGLLSLGAAVRACDQSPWALNRTIELCHPFADRLSTQRIDLVEWNVSDEKYDLVFCFGVVHHTGNTYLAIQNVARCVKPGGRLFLMVYGFPNTLGDFAEINAYEELRSQLRLLSFEERKAVLIKKFGPEKAHGWFDAISPRINDLLTFEEIADLLTRLGFSNIQRTLMIRNHHITADKPVKG